MAISPPFQRNSGTKWLKACLPGKKPRSLVRSGFFLITPAFVAAGPSTRHSFAEKIRNIAKIKSLLPGKGRCNVVLC